MNVSTKNDVDDNPFGNNTEDVTDPEATGTAAYGGLYRWCGTSTPPNDMRGNTSASDDHDTGSSYSSTNDTAKKIWGDNWRMPTQAEFQALIDNCTWSTFSAGYTITGKDGYSSNSIFLPAAGCFYYNGNAVFSVGTSGYYWSSTPNGSYAYFLFFSSSYLGKPYDYRKSGYSVRAVLVE